MQFHDRLSEIEGNRAVLVRFYTNLDGAELLCQQGYVVRVDKDPVNDFAVCASNGQDT